MVRDAWKGWALTTGKNMIQGFWSSVPPGMRWNEIFIFHGEEQAENLKAPRRDLWCQGKHCCNILEPLKGAKTEPK